MCVSDRERGGGGRGYCMMRYDMSIHIRRCTRGVLRDVASCLLLSGQSIIHSAASSSVTHTPPLMGAKMEPTTYTIMEEEEEEKEEEEEE